MLSPVVMAYSYTLEISEQALQEKLSSMLPIERKFLVFNMTLSDPKVSLLKDTNKIGLYIAMAVTAPDGSAGTGRVNITGTLSYTPAQGAFYIADPIVENIEVDRLQLQYATDIKMISQMLVASILASHPVYTLQTDDLRQKYLKSVLESVAVDQGKLLVTLKAF